MSQFEAPPSYLHSSIRSVASLSRVLGYPTSMLQLIGASSSSRYRLAKPIIKPDGSMRQPVDALPPLKGIQIRIKERILEKVLFPAYLTGSLKGRDPVRNADLHRGASITVCEDITSFFPSTGTKIIFDIWSGFFRFSNDVATLLTQLTTKDGNLPQGAVTSSHLANLAFWRREHALYIRLAEEGVTYSRYVDDVTFSSVRNLEKECLTRNIGRVYGMMASLGYRAKRSKQEIQRSHQQMRATKLLVNRRAAMTPAERHAIRAAVYEIERHIATGDVHASDLIERLDSAMGRVGRLLRLHAAEGRALQERVKRMRQFLKLTLS